MLPKGWTVESGEFKISEITTTSDLHNIGTKYIECITDGIIFISLSEANLYIDKGYLLKLHYYDGSNWTDIGNTSFDNAIDENEWLSYSNNRLVFNLTLGKRITNLIIQKGEIQ